MHFEPLLLPLIKSKNDDKSDKYFIKIKLRRDMMSKRWDPYDFKMAFFGISEPEEFLLFIQNYNMTLAVSGTLKAGANIKYLCVLVHGETLHHFEALSAELESAIL